jgi:hypothetical protein
MKSRSKYYIEIVRLPRKRSRDWYEVKWRVWSRGAGGTYITGQTAQATSQEEAVQAAKRAAELHVDTLLAEENAERYDYP